MVKFSVIISRILEISRGRFLRVDSCLLNLFPNIPVFFPTNPKLNPRSVTVVILTLKNRLMVLETQTNTRQRQQYLTVSVQRLQRRQRETLPGAFINKLKDNIPN